MVLDLVLDLVVEKGPVALRPGKLAGFLGMSRQHLHTQFGPAMELQRRAIQHAVNTRRMDVIEAIRKRGSVEQKELVRQSLLSDDCSE